MRLGALGDAMRYPPPVAPRRPYGLASAARIPGSVEPSYRDTIQPRDSAEYISLSTAITLTGWTIRLLLKLANRGLVERLDTGEFRRRDLEQAARLVAMTQAKLNVRLNHGAIIILLGYQKQEAA